MLAPSVESQLADTTCTRAGEVYVEVHRDIYRYDRSLAAESRAAFARQHIDPRVDRRVLDAALKSADGVPVRVSPDGVVARRPEE